MPHDRQHFHVCLYGDAFSSGSLQTLQGRTAQQIVIDIERITDPDRAASCHLLYISGSEADNLAGILAKVANHHILTVSDIDQFAAQGGMIELSMQKDQRIHLSINKGAIDAAGLILSQRVLNLAETIR